MNTKSLIVKLLTSILIFGIFLIPFAVFNLSFARFLLTYVPYLLASGVFSLIVGFTINKNRLVGGSVIFIWLFFISFIMIFVNMMHNENKEQVIWNAADDRFTIDFIVGNSGFIYINATVNDISGLFLFDTGYNISAIDERIVTDEKMKLHLYTTVDIKGIQQTKNLFKVNQFELGTIGLKKLQVYPADSLSWTDPNGFLYKQDSVIGVIGSNIISKFVWDFDLINHRVTISNSKEYSNNIPDSMAVKLYPNHNCKNIKVNINGEEKNLMLDFGAAFPISISDSIFIKSTSDEKRTHGTMHTIGVFNHLEQNERKESNFDFADVKLGAFEFNEIKCLVNEHSDLLGIPFIWAFERVIVDNMTDKVYFINENDHKFAANRYSKENILSFIGNLEVTAKPEGMVFVNKQDNIETRYIFYGKMNIYQRNSILDSISYRDSLLLPNGQIQYGPATFKIDF